jgi:CheY-specific phosphatase CheX
LDSRDELLEPIITAVATTLREMAGVEVVVRETFRAAGGEGLADVSIALRLVADADGLLILSLPRGTADTLARRVLGEVTAEPDEGLMQDCAAELLNVMAGQAKALLFGTRHHFTLSTPTVLTTLPIETAGRVVVRFDSDAGEFSVHLCPPLATAGTGAGESSHTGPGG